MSLVNKFKSGWRTLLPTCREASRLQSDALEQPLSPARRFGLMFHLLVCKWCRRYGRQLRFLHTAAHEHREALTAQVPQKLDPAARERIKQRLQSGGN